MVSRSVRNRKWSPTRSPCAPALPPDDLRHHLPDEEGKHATRRRPVRLHRTSRGDLRTTVPSHMGPLSDCDALVWRVPRLQQDLRRHRPDEEGSARRRSSARLDRHRGDLGTSASSHTGPLTVRAAMRLGHTRSRRRHRPRCLLRAPGGFAPSGLHQLAPFEPATWLGLDQAP